MQASRALLLPAAQRLPAPLRATARRSSSSSGGGGRCRRRAAATRAMLLEHLPALEGHRLVLASASPRRRELLAQMGLKFEVRVAGGALGQGWRGRAKALLAVAPSPSLQPAPRKGSTRHLAAVEHSPQPPAHPTHHPLPHPPPQVVVSSFEETLPKDSVGAAEYARLTALHKAQDVARKLAAAAAGSSGAGSGDGGAGGGGLPTLIIGADTVVEHGEHILEKPADAADAERVLRMLSGQEHHVHTGVALIMPGASGGPRRRGPAAGGARSLP